MADNLNKKPKKGILKNSSSFDAPDQSAHKKSKSKDKGTKWDEMNIIATLHPADKDYGHMKVDEPKTPFVYDDDSNEVKELDVDALAAKIKLAEDKPPKVLQSRSVDSVDEDDEDELTPDEKQKKKEFEMKRKKHYNEYYAIKMAKKLLEEEDEDGEADVKKKTQQKSKGSKDESDDSSNDV